MANTNPMMGGCGVELQWDKSGRGGGEGEDEDDGDVRREKSEVGSQESGVGSRSQTRIPPTDSDRATSDER